MGSGSSRRRGAAGPAGRGAVAANRELPGTAPSECEEAAAGPPAPGRRAPAAGGIPPPRDGGGCGEAAAGGGGSPPEQARLPGGLNQGRHGLLQTEALPTRSPPAPENNNADHRCPQSNSKKPSGQSTISYDYSEEELMASIEREYCR